MPSLSLNELRVITKIRGIKVYKGMSEEKLIRIRINKTK